MRTRQLPAVRREGGKRMKFGRLRTAALVSVCAGVAMLGTASAERFRLSHNTSNTTTWHKGAEKFDELLKEATGGDMQVRAFPNRSEENTSELLSLMRNSYAGFSLKKKTTN